MEHVHVDVGKQGTRHGDVPTRQLGQTRRGPRRYPRVDQEQTWQGWRATTTEPLLAVQRNQCDAGIGQQPHHDQVFPAGLNLTGQQHAVPLLGLEAPALVLYCLQQLAPYVHVPHCGQHLYRIQVGLAQLQPCAGKPDKSLHNAVAIEQHLVPAIGTLHCTDHRQRLRAQTIAHIFEFNGFWARCAGQALSSTKMIGRYTGNFDPFSDGLTMSASKCGAGSCKSGTTAVAPGPPLFQPGPAPIRP